MIKAIVETEYECPCGKIVKVKTEIHLCKRCFTAQCPNCFDYDKELCEECLSN